MLRTTNLEWQKEAWNFYRNLGAFKYAQLWFAQTLSRVRLAAAVSGTAGSPPEIVTSGPAFDAMNSFFNGTAGQSQFMKSISTQLNVPGEGYVVMYDDPSVGERCFHVKSISELRPSSLRAKSRRGGEKIQLWEMEIDAAVWQPLPPDTLVFRMWRPDEEKSYMPDSPAQAALPLMRIIDMMERRIVAQSVSRLASNGLLLYPQEVTFPAKPGYEKVLDPFTAEWLDIAEKAIQNPGSALAAIPMPVKVPQQYIKDFTHMDFANTYDERVMEILQSFYDKLGVAMNMPKEVVTGMGSSNHWNVWGLDEQGIEVHVKPDVEMICAGITKGYLHAWLTAAGAPLRDDQGREYIAWYSTSDLDVPPDRSAAADAAFDRQQISGAAYREAKGFPKETEPSKDELRQQLLLQMAKDPTQAPAAIEELTGSPVAGATTGPGGVDDGTPASQPTPATGPPDQPAERTSGTPSQPSSG